MQEIVYFTGRIVILENGELWRCEFVRFADGTKEFNAWGCDHTPWDGSIPW